MSTWSERYRSSSVLSGEHALTSAERNAATGRQALEYQHCCFDVVSAGDSTRARAGLARFFKSGHRDRGPRGKLDLKIGPAIGFQHHVDFVGLVSSPGDPDIMETRH